MTEKLYYKDSYIKEFYANIIDCIEYKNNYALILDKTAFFPCGGGQYGDVGLINGTEVIDTIEREGRILHIVKEKYEKKNGVICNVNQKIRFNRMQNHSGEHILSGLIYSIFKYNNVGFHLSDNDVTLDCDGKLSDEDIFMLENKANNIIDENRKISVYYPSPDELKSLEYRSKLNLYENVRIVEIDGVDKCACCAPHLRSTAEIGLIKIVKHYNYKGGTRMHIRCGRMAREDYTMVNNQITAISNSSSVKREEVLATFNKLNGEITVLKDTIHKLRAKEIENYVDNAEIINDIVFIAVENYSNSDMTLLLKKSIERFSITVIIISDCKDGSLSFITAGIKSVAVFDNLKTIGAKGGGKEFIMGKVSTDINIIKDNILSCDFVDTAK